jgi:hypothetical protein
MEDFNSKYTGQQVEDLLDQVASGNAGGGGAPIVSQDTYIAPFTVEDVGSLYNGGIATLSIPIALIEAVIAKKRVLIPSNFDFGNGFAELTYAEGYVAEADAGLIAFFFMLREMYSIYIDDAISDGAIIVSKEQIHRAVVPGPDEIVGISSIEQTTTSNADGGSNVVTATLSNGTKSTFTIKNGSKGSVGEQGPKGDKEDPGVNGKDGADGATFTPSVDSAGNLSWTNNKGLTNPPTVNIKGPKGDKGDAGEGGGGSSGSSEIETIYLESTFGGSLVIDEMLAEKRYYIWLEENGGEDAHKEVIFLSFEGHNADTRAIKHFYAVIELGTNNGEPVKTTLCFPDDYPIYYPNGEVPEIAEEGGYEVSITQVTDQGWTYYNVVVTPFG